MTIGEGADCFHAETCDGSVDLSGLNSMSAGTIPDGTGFDYSMISTAFGPDGYTLTHDFEMMSTEVTEGLFLALMGFVRQRLANLSLAMDLRHADLVHVQHAVRRDHRARAVPHGPCDAWPCGSTWSPSSGSRARSSHWPMTRCEASSVGGLEYKQWVHRPPLSRWRQPRRARASAQAG